MELKPDLVAISGDIVTGHSSEVKKYLDILAPLSRAPLGAWYCYGRPLTISVAIQRTFGAV